MSASTAGKKILVYCWGSDLEPSLINTLKDMGYDCAEYTRKIQDYHADARFAEELITLLHTEKPDAIFSYDYFPLISSICEINGLPYLVWVYDCPLYTLFSETLRNTCNCIFCFDASYAEQLRALGGRNVWHFPLGVDMDGMQQMLKSRKETEKKRFSAEISFLGSLYNGSNNRFRKGQFEEYVRGYMEGLIEAQYQVYGVRFLEKAMSEEVAEQIAIQCRLELGSFYHYEKKQLAADVLGLEVTARERERLLGKAAQAGTVMLYTGSELPKALRQEERIINRGYVDHEREMPIVFEQSKINMNITSRNITSGIPMRVLDILACEGFCLTNYQPEIAEYFTDGEELVIYTDEEDFLDKIGYYLSHEKERQEIAARGFAAIRDRFSLRTRIAEMFNLIY